MSFDLNTILRENIKKLVPYSSARDEYKGKDGVFLDANENSFGSPLPKEKEANYNRYPDPLQLEVKEKISKIKGLPVENIFLGNGSDEAIDILFRAFCNPGKDNAIICPPTYGMYEVSANINDVQTVKVPLTPETFQLDTEKILQTINDNTKLIFICCPNNPTGNGVKWDAIKAILEKFNGIVLVDEAYINFATYQSLIPKLLQYPNLVIIQTLSKAWGMAGLRIGMAFASQAIIDVFNKIKPPYNINAASQKLALEALNNVELVNNWIKEIVQEREKLAEALSTLPFVLKIYPSEANFLLVKTTDPKRIYSYLTDNKIIIRDRSSVTLCEGALRITIGTKEENKQLLDKLKLYIK
ncbi:MAG TPA: histidinol-phosphate transaminase [Bacteroidia bacterium]|jgi:histidinol-phosphate aminotransferase|nr:histidinol-phosphate transaminase [Bacteroidia bacterium]